MNKKMMSFLLGAIVLFLSVCVYSCGSDGSKVKLAQTVHDPENVKTDCPTAVDIYIDASGSMKGYVDGVQGTFKTNIPNLATNMKNKQSLGLHVDSIKCYTIDNTKLVFHKTNDFRDNISNTKIFNGKSTELHKMFKVVAEQTRINTNHVGVIVTDCILSFPAAEIKMNHEKNINDIGILENNVTDAMTDLVNSNMSVAIVKYESDFNGKYYYTYHDKALPCATGKIMSSRPYYLIMIGAKGKLDAMFNKEALADGYSDIYMYNTECAKPNYKIVRAIKSGAVSDIKENVPEVRVNQKGNTAYFYLAMEDFAVPSYMEKDLPSIMSSPKVLNSLIDKCEKIEFNSMKDDYKILSKSKKKESVSCTYLYKITLKSNEELRDIAAGTIDKVFFTAKSMDASKNSIENDEVTDISELEGKTFMFENLIKGIEKAYIGIDSNIASVEINISKK